MSKHAACVAALMFSAAFTHAAAPLNDWASQQRLDVTAPGLVRVALPPETFDAAQASLADLRLLDPTGAEVPYLIERPRATTRTLRPQDGWQVFLEANRTRIEIDVNVRGRLTAIAIDTPASEFLKAASLSDTAGGKARASQFVWSKVSGDDDGTATACQRSIDMFQSLERDQGDQFLARGGGNAQQIDSGGREVGEGAAGRTSALCGGQFGP